MAKILNKRGAIIFEVMAAVAIIGIVSILVYTYFASMSLNATNGYETRMAVEYSNKIMDYFESIEDKFVIPSQTYIMASENDNAFCTTRYIKETDIKMCKNALSIETSEVNFEIKVYFFNFDERNVLDNLKNNASDVLLKKIEQIQDEVRADVLNPNLFNILIEITSKNSNKAMVVNKVVAYV